MIFMKPLPRSSRTTGPKIRVPIGCKGTLRRDRMYEFLDRLVTSALPRVRDFRGLNPKSGKATRVRFEVRDGKKVRVAVKSGETIDG
jgi:hypothetical protein